jgi:hypothetical protein
MFGRRFIDFGFLIIETTVVGLLTFNVLEGIHALNYPPPPVPAHPASPAARKTMAMKDSRGGAFKAVQTPKKPFTVLSPNVRLSHYYLPTDWLMSSTVKPATTTSFLVFSAGIDFRRLSVLAFIITFKDHAIFVLVDNHWNPGIVCRDVR